jgi:hypothetical protein
MRALNHPNNHASFEEGATIIIVGGKKGERGEPEPDW